MILLSRLKISGHSMQPTLQEGNFVFVSSVPFIFVNPQKEDIIVFKKKGKLIIKRIKEIKNDKYKVLGDNRKDSLDFGWVEKTDILGKVIYK
jgi:signal peptidase I